MPTQHESIRVKPGDTPAVGDMFGPRRMTPAEHYEQAELCLFHAAAAQFGSPEEDSYLRVAAIHAALANVDTSSWHMNDMPTRKVTR